MKHQAFAFVRPDGSYKIDSRFSSEDAVWKLYARDRYALEKAGYRVMSVEVETDEAVRNK